MKVDLEKVGKVFEITKKEIHKNNFSMPEYAVLLTVLSDYRIQKYIKEFSGCECCAKD